MSGEFVVRVAHVAGTGNSRPMSEASTVIPSQTGVQAAFSRPITAANSDLQTGETCLPMRFTSKGDDDDDDDDDDDESIDNFLITQIKEALQDTPPPRILRFRRCTSEDANITSAVQTAGDIFNPEEWDTDLDSDTEDSDKWEDGSFRKLYTQICHRLGVVPISHFLRHIEDSAVSLKYRGVISSETSALAQCLQSILKIEKLNLEGNFIGWKGCRHLCRMLESNLTISELNIAENNLTDKSMDALSTMLAHNGSLRKLSLAGNMLTDNSAHDFADCLEDCKLKVLDISKNTFGDKGGVILGPALSTNVYLDVLNLSWNHIREAGALGVAKGLKENVRLSVCDLSWNGFGESGGLALADALFVNTSLKEVDISSNRLTFSVAVRFAKALAVNEVLEVLKMANNPITTSGCLALVESVNRSERSILSYLDLYENPVEYEFLKLAKDLVAKKPDFQIYHGAILRAGNTHQDIGKSAVDIVRLSQRPIMLLDGQLIVNDLTKFMERFKKYAANSDKCTAEQLQKIVEELDSAVNCGLLAQIIANLPRDEAGRILIRDLLA